MASVSQANPNLRLSELFEDDESNGDRLVEYLQSKQGALRQPAFLFAQADPQRLSLEVQLERLPESQETLKNKATDAGGDVENQPINQTGTNIANRTRSGKNLRQNEAAKPPDEGFKLNISPLSPLLAKIRKSGGISPCDRLRRYTLARLSNQALGRRSLLPEFESTVSESAFKPNICSTPLTQGNPDSTIKDKNITSVDSQSNVCSGDNAVNCANSLDNSLEEHGGDRQLSHLILERIANASQQNAADKSICRKSSVGRTYTMERGEMAGQVILTPQRSGNEEFVIGNRNNNSTQRTAPIDCSNRSLTTRTWARANATCTKNVTIEEQMSHIEPDKSIVNASTRQSSTMPQVDMEITNLESPVHRDTFKATNDASQACGSPVADNSGSRIRITIGTSTSEKDLVASDKAAAMPSCQLSMTRNERSGNSLLLELPNEKGCRTPSRTSVRRSSTPAPDEEELYIPETQECQQHVRSIVSIASEHGLMAINITSGQPTPKNDRQDSCRNITVEKENLGRNTTVEKDKLIDAPDHASIPAVDDKSAPSPKGKSLQQADTLKLSDIMTDDDEAEAAPLSLSNSSTLPLNLAETESSSRRKLRKRSISRRRTRREARNSNPDSESEPLALSLTKQSVKRKRIFKRQQVPLNKPPGKALNGEEFAKELARMSNYEILDLRKRNSMGRIFPIVGRKSEKAREQATKKQIQLDDEIELELLRRNRQPTLDDHALPSKDGPRRSPEKDVSDSAPDEPFLPVPEEFCDRESSLVDERSCDRISFRNHSSLKGKKTQSTARTALGSEQKDLLEQYLEVSKRFSKRSKARSLNRSKRCLYTRGMSDVEDTLSGSRIDECNKTSLPMVPSPPLSEVDNMPPLRVASPPPPLSAGNSIRAPEHLNQHASFRQSRGLPPPPPLPPPPQFDTDSGISCNIVAEDVSPSSDQEPQQQDTEHTTSQHVFKKPTQCAPKKRIKRQRPVGSSESLLGNTAQSSSHISADSSEDSSLRRSKRGHVPLQFPSPQLQCRLQEVWTKYLQKPKKPQKNPKRKAKSATKDYSTQKSDSTNTQLTALQETDTDNKAKGKAVIAQPQKVKKANTKLGKKKTPSTKLDSNSTHSNTPAPLDLGDDVFDRLRNSSHSDVVQDENIAPEKEVRVKKLAVRVARLKQSQLECLHGNESDRTDTTNGSRGLRSRTECSSAISSTGDSIQSGFDLISWLKNNAETSNSSRNDEIFKEMRISSASNLCFTELQGVEYAFYDTDDVASLGYLRFKPRQKKPRKRAKRYHLHFVTLIGSFRITANDKERIIGPGDMVAIEKSIYYDIENLSDDVGVLMVVKK